MVDQRPSRFVQEIPAGTVPIFDGSYWNSMQTSQFFSGWMSGTDSFRQAPTSFSQQKVSMKAESVKKFTPTSSLKTTETKSKLTSSLWKKNQPVSHPKFGLGIVEDVELRPNGATYLQVKFKSGSKKLEASFVKST